MTKYFLTIAASDNSGGAGVQRDLNVAHELGYWGLSAITGITIQDFTELKKIYPINTSIVQQQTIKNINSFSINAIKIGALCSDENIKMLSIILQSNKFPVIVLDPVFAPTRGPAFTNSIGLFKDSLLPYIDIITPNKDELALLVDEEITDFEQAIECAKNLVNDYQCNIYLTGGHFSGDKITEALITAHNSSSRGLTAGSRFPACAGNDSEQLPKTEVNILHKEKLKLTCTHGTGCAFSSALSCFLGNGDTFKEAGQKASEFVSNFNPSHQAVSH